MDEDQSDSQLLHELGNHLAVICVYSKLGLRRNPKGELLDDLLEIHKASAAALALVPQLTPRHCQE